MTVMVPYFILAYVWTEVNRDIRRKTEENVERGSVLVTRTSAPLG
jgi:hypothetical protein